MPRHNIKQVKGATQGSILFLGANTSISENNSKLFWNIANNALVIGTSSLFGTEKLRLIGDQRIDGNLLVTGSFAVLGSASVINTTNLTISDPIILLAASQSGSPVLDSGFFINRGTGATQGFIWDESATEFAFIQTNDKDTVIGNVNISSYSKIRAGGITTSQIKITTGAVNNYVLSSDATGLGSWVSASSLIPNGVTGVGVLNYVPRWLSSNNLSATGSIYDTGTFVGIGVTNSLNYKLQVAGSVSTTGFRMTNGAALNSILSSDATGIATWKTISTLIPNNTTGVGTTNYIPKWSGVNTLSGTSSIYDTGTFVGIGTTTPLYKLQVLGTVSTTGFRMTNGATNNYVMTSDANGVGTWMAPSGGGPTGSGTLNYGARWISSTQLGIGSIRDSGTNVGVLTAPNVSYAIDVLGDVNITGTLYATSKSFEIEHPLDSKKRLVYGSLEGPEYGVYYRGKLVNNNIIELPDYWTGLIDEKSITVDITPFGSYQRIFVSKIENNKVYLGVDNGGLPNCYYVVYAERNDIDKIVVEK